MAWLDRIPYAILIFFAVAMMLVPFGASHFVEKWTMFFRGTLRRPLDWFDLVMHSAPLLLLIVKVALQARARS